MNYGIEYLVPVTIALVEVVKRTGYLPKNLCPLFSLALGGVIGYLAGLTGIDLLLVGLGASGLYSLGKAPVNATISRIRG